MTRYCVCDFETASAVDLKKAGAWAYAEHPTTEVLCLSFEPGPCKAWANPYPPVLTWYPPPPVKAPMEKWNNWRLVSGQLQDLLEDPDVMFVSHGDFERAIWHHIMVPIHGFPPLPNDRWHDTMAVAAQKQLPLDLDKLTRVLRLANTKDKEGSAFTRALSKPNKKTGMLDRSPASFRRVYDYCESDVRAERTVLDRLGRLQPGERKVWLLDQTINQRGIKIDLPYVLACQKVVDGATKPLAAEFTALTGIKFTQRDKFMGWIKDQGVDILDLRKDTVAGILGDDIDSTEDDFEGDVSDDTREGAINLPPPVRRALGIRQLVGSASVKKLSRMAACISGDHRARGLLQYHRAGPGRWAGRIIQPQNFPRPSLKDSGGNLLSIDTIVNALMTGDHEWVEMVCGAAIETVVSGLRHALIADKGRRFISGDYAQIEARIVLALAGQHDKVKLFETGTPYIDMAEAIYGRKISKKNDIAEYTIGKNTVLGCGFQMGAQKFFDRYCPNQSIDFAEGVVRTYRKEWAPMVPPLWYALQQAAVDTVWSGTPHEAYGVEYRLEDGWLTARIPSGRKLFYWNPKKFRAVMPWLDYFGKAIIRPAFTYEALKMGQWKTVHAFGGLLTENVVQGLARDVLVHAMFKLEANGFPLVLTVHDEAIGEPETVNADELAFKQIMEETAPWVKAMGIPIAVETWAGQRYRK